MFEDDNILANVFIFQAKSTTTEGPADFLESDEEMDKILGPAKKVYISPEEGDRLLDSEDSWTETDENKAKTEDVVSKTKAMLERIRLSSSSAATAATTTKEKRKKKKK